MSILLTLRLAGPALRKFNKLHAGPAFTRVSCAEWRGTHQRAESLWIVRENQSDWNLYPVETAAYGPILCRHVDGLRLAAFSFAI